MSKRKISIKVRKAYNTERKDNNSNHYNFFINQNNTYNQDNTINIMLESNISYLNNYSLQSNDKEQKNQFLFFQENNQKIKDTNKKKSEEKIFFTKKINKCPINLKNNIKKKTHCQTTKNSTNKIDYRYVKKYPIKQIMPENNKNDIGKNKECQLFWFATYGKLMKTKNLIKILNYYNNKFFGINGELYNISSLKEKSLKINDFEIFFCEKSNKPYIKYSKGKHIYVKLYLLTLKEISLIFSYLNRIEYEINYESLNYLQNKGDYQIINDNNKSYILPFHLIYCLGEYMNINIYTFSNIFIYDNDINGKMYNIHLPKSKKIVKLISIINKNFPDFSLDEIFNYLIPENKYLNSISKINEIKNIIINKKINQNKIFLSSIVKETIKGISIQTPKSIISSFFPEQNENNQQNKIDLFKNNQTSFPLFKDECIPINTHEKNSKEKQNIDEVQIINNDIKFKREISKKNEKFIKINNNIKKYKNNKKKKIFRRKSNNLHNYYMKQQIRSSISIRRNRVNYSNIFENSLNKKGQSNEKNNTSYSVSRLSKISSNKCKIIKKGFSNKKNKTNPFFINNYKCK